MNNITNKNPWKWDYTKVQQNWEDSFYDDFVKDIGKKKPVQAITFNGVLTLAKQKGIKSLTTEIIQLPAKENNMLCIMQATLIGYDINPITGELIEVTYKATGDASPSNCTPMVAASFVRMADTRAKGRVCKDYVNACMVTTDELGDNNSYISDSDDEESEPLATKKQLEELNMFVTKYKVKQEWIQRKINKRYGEKDIQDLTETEASELIELIKTAIKKAREKKAAESDN